MSGSCISSRRYGHSMPLLSAVAACYVVSKVNLVYQITFWPYAKYLHFMSQLNLFNKSLLQHVNWVLHLLKFHVGNGKNINL